MHTSKARSFGLGAIVGGVLGSVVGCAAPAANSKPVAPTEAVAPHLRRSAEEGGPHLAEQHHEPTPNPAQGTDVSLAGILAYADQHSPILAVARATRSRAEAARVAAAVVLSTNPELTAALGPRLSAAGTGLDVQLSLMQQLQVGGERGAREQAAERTGQLTDAEIEEVRWAVHCDVHAAFHRALVEREQLGLAARVVAFQQEVLRAVERQISAGETAPLTLRLAQAEVAQSEQVQVAAEQAYLAARLRLAQLSGWPAAAPPEPGGNVDTPREPPSLQSLTQVAGERQPNLRSAAARIQWAAAQLDVADREGSIRPSVGVQYQHEGSRAPEGSTNIVLGVVSLPIPVFARNQGDRATARAELSVARAEFGAVQQLLAGRIAEARSEVVAAAKRTRTYGTEILPRFEENLTLLRRSFELGEIDIMALSTGRERFLRIQNDALLAQRDYFVALAGLERIVGVDLWHDDHEKDVK